MKITYIVKMRFDELFHDVKVNINGIFKDIEQKINNEKIFSNEWS